MTDLIASKGRSRKHASAAYRKRAYAGTGDWYFQGSSWAFGGSYSDGLEMRFTSDETIAALEYDRAFIHDDGLGYLASDPRGDFISGAAATLLQSTGSLTGIDDAAEFEYGCAFLPRQEATGVLTGGGMSILRYASDDGGWQGLVEYTASTRHAHRPDPRRRRHHHR